MTTDQQRHIIGKQHLDVTFNGSERSAMALQSAISELSRLGGVTTAIERILDGYADSASVLRINRLEVDARAVQLDQLEERLPAMIAEALDKALGEVGVSGENIPLETDDWQTGKRLSKEESAVDAFLFFLQHGSLPSTFRPQSHESFETQLLEAWKSPAIARQTANALTSPTARQRFLAQFSRQVTAMLIEELSPDAMPIIENLLDRFRHSALPDGLVTRIERKLLDETLALFATQTRIAPKELQTMLTEITASLPEVPDEFQSDDVAQAPTPRTKQRPSTTENPGGKAAWQTRAPAPPVHRDSEQTPQPTSNKATQEPEKLRADRSDGSARSDESQVKSDASSRSRNASALDREAEDLSREQTFSPGSRDTDALDREAEEVPQEQTSKPLAHETSRDQPETDSQESFSDSVNSSTALKNRKSGNLRTTRPDTTEAARAHPDERNGLYVENAGLVLLHPFLPQFFTALKVAEDEVLLQPDRALQLLHFLATGSENVPEYELVLPKILCGLAPASLAGKTATLSDEEKEESEALLSAVTRHWDVLKNTGIDALRETYLKRNGKLTRWHDGGWLLQVESKSFDILLDLLPWGFSMIRLPWMPSMLHVEWHF
ncbi:MAG TPA: hypothetical protein ENL01_05155 [Chlorobaculum parvum]|uniref:Uncharacterized protein n=1 Tax=Chlorobaculum parvum TaxID=274539 RepID=A0A7C5HHH0_9CHLB|nr:hypothetical protein [Chlorobaculum parvum]